MTNPSPSNRHRNPELFSPNYLVYIKSDRHNCTVVARAPQELSLSLNSEWDTPLAQNGISSVVEVAIQEGLNLSKQHQYASAQVWSGSSPIEITLDLEFQAEEDPVREVVQPIINLGKMLLPELKGDQGDLGFFTPPGPKVFNKGRQFEDFITVSLGGFMVFKKVIVLSVNPVYNVRDMGVSGLPLRATCSVTFRTYLSLTGSDFASMFQQR